jgi:phage gpG-like protein
MQIKFSVRDHISPQLARLASSLANRIPILEALGLQLVSLTKRAFNDASLRPSTWAAVKKAGPKNAPLKLSGALYQSIKISGLTNNSVTVSSDRPYAAIHQLGGKTKAHIIRPRFKRALAWPGAAHPMKLVNHPGSNIPARPYFPFRPDGYPTPMAIKKLEAILRAKLQPMLPK